MRFRKLRQAVQRAGAVVLGAALLISTGGCVIDTNAVVTETVRAGLEAAVSSLVDSLSAYLAGQ